MFFPRTVRSSFLPVLATAVALAGASSARAAATLKGEYFFGNTLSSSQPGGPTLTAVDPLAANAFETDTVLGQSRTVYHWDGTASPTNLQAGFTLATSGVVTSNSYSVELVLEFLERDSGWRRILDVHNRADDTGFYVNPSNGLEVFPTAGATNNFVANAYRHVVLTDDSGVVKGYLDGGLEFTSNTTLMDVDANNLMSFFLDNIAAGGQGEFADGKIALLRVYDGVLPDSQVAQLAASPFTPQAGATPEPASLGVLAIGAVGLLWRRRLQR